MFGGPYETTPDVVVLLAHLAPAACPCLFTDCSLAVVLLLMQRDGHRPFGPVPNVHAAGRGRRWGATRRGRGYAFQLRIMHTDCVGVSVIGYSNERTVRSSSFKTLAWYVASVFVVVVEVGAASRLGSLRAIEGGRQRRAQKGPKPSRGLVSDSGLLFF